MTTSFDRSHNDKKYFIDGSIYNCPFCNRRNVKYTVKDKGHYHKSNTKNVFFYIIECDDCEKISFHLSNYLLKVYDKNSLRAKTFAFPPKQITQGETSSSPQVEADILNKEGSAINELDELFFYHDPTAFFTIDNRIPLEIREPLSEADNCLKSNFLTGASACLRKSIYKLLQHESIKDSLRHDKRIELLKKKYPKIDGSLLNKLKKVHTLTSQELHENDWQDFNSHSLRFLLEATKEVLIEMYVLPDEKIKRDKELSDLETKAKGKIANKTNNEKK